MKGTRTYQLVAILIIFAIFGILKIFGKDLGFDLDSLKLLSSQAEEFGAGLLKIYAAALAIWKLLKPHPMKHEKNKNV